jgi:lipopolysaccharide assembly protein A
MQLLTWAMRLLIFFFLLAFAFKNAEPVTLRFIFGQSLQAPLVAVVLFFVVVGVLLGLLALLGSVLRQRREIAGLRREIEASRVRESSPS